MSDQPYDPGEEDSDYWLPEEAIKSLVTERTIMSGETYEQTAKRLFKENAPLVAQSICAMAIRSRNERVRFDAGRYIIDRVLGRVGEERLLSSESPLDIFVSEVENHLKNEANK